MIKKSKQKRIIFFISLALSLLGVSSLSSLYNSQPVFAYNCGSIKESTKKLYGDTAKLVYNNGVCQVQYQADAPPESTNGSGQITCKSGDTISADKKSCTTPATAADGTVPLRNDGTPSQASDWKCEGSDTYILATDGRHKCKGEDCIIGFICSDKYYDPTEAQPDPSRDAKKDCLDKGGDWATPASGNGGTCKNTEASCKSEGKMFSAGQCVTDAAAACTAQFPSKKNPLDPRSVDTNKAARDACIAGAAGNSCEAQPTQVLKDACEKGVKSKQNQNASSGDAGTCGKAKTNIVTCNGSGTSALGDVLKIILFILTVIIGIVATGGIVYGAILYASAQDNAGQVSQAKTIIRDVIIGIILYGFMVAIVNWLVPGGIIS